MPSEHQMIDRSNAEHNPKLPNSKCTVETNPTLAEAVRVGLCQDDFLTSDFATLESRIAKREVPVEHFHVDSWRTRTQRTVHEE